MSRLCSPPSQRMLQFMLHHAPSRGLTTLLFTDIADSTGVVVQLGDRRWKAIQSRHHAVVRRQLKRHGGHEVDTAGDGFLATFSSPATGVRCAAAIIDGVRELGLEVRAGLHIGEAELTGEKVSGIAVTTAARVSPVAGPGQVLVTSTIEQLVAGSGLEFSGVGTRELKGVPGTWELFALTAVDDQPMGNPSTRRMRPRRGIVRAPTGHEKTTSASASVGTGRSASGGAGGHPRPAARPVRLRNPSALGPRARSHRDVQGGVRCPGILRGPS